MCALTKINGNTSTHPHIPHSRLTKSDNLLTSNGCATVLVAGNAFGSLLNPYAIAQSSTKSTGWRISGRVGGRSRVRSGGGVGRVDDSGVVEEVVGGGVEVAIRPIRLRRCEISSGGRERPV